MKLRLNRRYHFSASHRLHNPALGDDENRACYGKCNNPHGHGHNYTVEVTLAGPVDATTGMVTNLGDLDPYMHREIVERFDLADLNSDPWFHHTVPTTEALAERIFEHISANYGLAKLERVRVEETENNAFEITNI